MITSAEDGSLERKCTDLGEDGLAIILGAGQACVQETGLLDGVGRIVR